ncbi:MAG: hypothetical protein R3C49_12090 [Planctomycetaceae bacterium]
MISQLVFSVAVLAGFGWQPTFTEPSDVVLNQPVVALVTHSSFAFDPLGVTRVGTRQTVSRMKRAGYPVVYLHDRHNVGNPFWLYLYDDWRPTAYVRSDIGHVRLNFGPARHVVCLGGFFGQCERATVHDVVRTWYGSGQQQLRITQITDAVYTIVQHVTSDDHWAASVRGRLRELRQRNPNAAMSLDEMLMLIGNPEGVVRCLQRQLPQLPPDVNVVMDVFGRGQVLQVAGPNARTLVFAYRRSDGFLNTTGPSADFSGPRSVWTPPDGWQGPVSSADPGFEPAVSPTFSRRGSGFSNR